MNLLLYSQILTLVITVSGKKYIHDIYHVINLFSLQAIYGSPLELELLCFCISTEIMQCHVNRLNTVELYNPICYHKKPDSPLPHLK